MPFTWEFIDKDWLFSHPIGASKNAVTAAFNKVEQEFGQVFFTNYRGPRGQFIVSLIMDLQTLIHEQENSNYILPSHGEILRNIRHGEILKSANIIRLSAYFLRNGCKVESEPELLIKGITKHPDMKVKYEGYNVFVEESAYNVSDRQREIESVFDEIKNVINEFERSIWVDIQLLKEDASKNEILEVIDVSNEMANEEIQPRKRVVGDIAEVATFLSPDQKLNIKEIRPALCQAGLLVGTKGEVHLQVGVPFMDARVSRMLDKMKQLPDDMPNLIVLDLTHSGNMNRLFDLTKEFLKPDEHRNISGVLLIALVNYIDKIEIEHRFIEHPHPYVQLPTEFKQLTNEFYTNNSYYLYRRINKNITRI